MTAALRAADLAPSGWLEPGDLAVILRSAYDPVVAGALERHGELGRNEETVEQYQDQCKEDHAEIGEECREGDTRGRVHDGGLQVPCVQ